jgi:2-polyprenyl-3-methyl-5-hydroxy-6-metoxy-1,4-benzoquinol methylase
VKIGDCFTGSQSRFGIELQRELGEGYDVVTLWDVIEHLREPCDTLTEIRRRMKPGGRLFIETGNWASWRHLKDGDRWGLILLDHQFYFTPNSLAKLVSAAGFRGFHLVNRYGDRGRFSPAKLFYRLTVRRRNILVGSAVV